MLMILTMSIIDENVLIECVRKHPHLYDLSDRNYHNLPMTKQSWEAIGQSVNVPGTECKRKWNSLRDMYRKQLKKIKSNSDQGKAPVKPFKHQKAMSFLIPFLVERSQRTSLISESDFNNLPDDDFDPTDHSPMSPATVPIIEIISDGDSSSPPINNSHSSRRRKRSTLHPIAEVLDNYLKTKVARVDPRPADSLRKFFDAMEESVRCLKPSLQIEIKSKILALITEYEVKNMENTS